MLIRSLPLLLVIVSTTTFPQSNSENPVPAEKLVTTRSTFTFAPGQSVYVAASGLDLERKAKEQFRKEKRYKVVNVLRDAEFVFVIMLDPASDDTDELALAILPSDYRETMGDIDAMRNEALWQSQGHFRRGKEAAIAGATLGYSRFFRHPSIAKRLVQQFHREVR